jgi:uncharacterized membrane protein
MVTVPPASRRIALGTAAVLAICVVVAALGSAPWPRSLGFAALMLVPLALPQPGILRGRPRTCAWGTLCVAPYFLYGLTEVVANPAARTVAATVLFASLAWFAALVWCLRTARAAPRPAQDASAG